MSLEGAQDGKGKGKNKQTKPQADPRYAGVPTWHSGDWGREMASLRIYSKTQTEEKENRKGRAREEEGEGWISQKPRADIKSFPVQRAGVL